MKTNSFYNMLGLASRARKIVTGETLLTKVRSNDVYLVIIASDASDNSQKKICDKCTFYNIEYIIEGSIDDLSNAIGKSNRVAVGIMDIGFAKKIKEKIGG